VDGKDASYSTIALKYLVTDEAVDDSTVQENTVNAVAEAVLALFESHDIRFIDLNMIFQKVKWSADTYQDRAMSKAAGLLDEYDGITEKQLRNIRISHIKNFLLNS
jgi:hypothetical protein